VQAVVQRPRSSNAVSHDSLYQVLDGASDPPTPKQAPISPRLLLLLLLLL
jgi:hypothetical protein